MNKAVVAVLVGVLGLALGFGAGWALDTVRGDEDSTGGSESPAPEASESGTATTAT